MLAKRLTSLRASPLPSITIEALPSSTGSCFSSLLVSGSFRAGAEEQQTSSSSSSSSSSQNDASLLPLASIFTRSFTSSPSSSASSANSLQSPPTTAILLDEERDEESTRSIRQQIFGDTNNNENTNSSNNTELLLLTRRGASQAEQDRVGRLNEFWKSKGEKTRFLHPVKEHVISCSSCPSSSNSSNSSSPMKAWLDAQLLHPRWQQSPSSSSSFPQSFVLRERTTGCVIAGESIGKIWSPFPRIGLTQQNNNNNNNVAMFPPAPFFSSSSSSTSSSSSSSTSSSLATTTTTTTTTAATPAVSKLERMKLHLELVRDISVHLQQLPQQQLHNNQSHQQQQCVHCVDSFKLACLVEQEESAQQDQFAIINDGRNALGQVSSFCELLLDALQWIHNNERNKKRNLIPDSEEELALWQHCFCRSLELYLRQHGCFVDLVDILQSQERKKTKSKKKTMKINSAGDQDEEEEEEEDNNLHQPTREAAFFLTLISKWTNLS